jgi:hypothetical protein
MVTSLYELAVNVGVEKTSIETTGLMILVVMKRMWCEYGPIDEANAIGCGLTLRPVCH